MFSFGNTHTNPKIALLLFRDDITSRGVGSCVHRSHTADRGYPEDDENNELVTSDEVVLTFSLHHSATRDEGAYMCATPFLLLNHTYTRSTLENELLIYIPLKVTSLPLFTDAYTL